MQHRINETRMYYELSGDPNATPLIFIHGFPFSCEMWKPQIEALQEYHLIAYDVRGHGKTEVGDGQYSVEYFVDDLIALMNHLNISRAAVLGLSMGGYIALRAIERHPDRFLALILCDTRSEADSNEAKIKRAEQAKVVKKDGAKLFAEGFVKAIFAPGSVNAVPAAIELIRGIISRTHPLAIAGTLIALSARTDTTASLESIHVPTLIMTGALDQVTPPAAAKSMHEKIKGSLLHLIPNAAHLSNLENPAAFNAHVKAFLKP